ncbi:heme-dependent oxidative N-demethylase family protein [Microbulbifer aggregans]|uniref:heme-dependent oxidative N-demethylase family protein n=1 Tax=Microbulbifer aggregans TaxID=1769779 RepID=UPI001CFE854E|nr:DUF3445 domain-containing protein [Microbulbifer aggregans]
MNHIFAGSASAAPQADYRYAQSPGALFLPFVTTPQIVHMGLNRLSAREWIQPCPQLPNYQHNKLCARRQLQERVFAFESRSLPAQSELASMLLGHLLADHRAYFRTAERLSWRAGAEVLHWPLPAAAAEPLWNASLWVADDICLLLPGPDGYELVAASLAAPSYWKLEDKIGRPLNQIHGPIPGFREHLAVQMARFFDHLRPEYPVWRSNWSVVGSPELLQRGGAEPAGDRLYLRVERQSLRRLPESGAVAFTIRVSINPLSDLLAVDGAVAALQAGVAAMSPQESRYKSLAPLLPQLQHFFAEHLSATSAAQRPQ